ncbi:TonB family protein [Myxococcota bacterium]|nr:TonB family protein [Myxococcota bacterium]
MGAQRQEQHKILRIGIIQGGKILEERLIKAGETVTVGEGEKNTFTLPPSRLPKRFPMFVAKGSQYSLAFTDGIEGRIAIGAQVHSLDALIEGGKAQKKGDHYQLPLSDENRGKVQVGAATILFQFVTPPPEPARATIDQLRRFAIDPSDMPFYGIVLISALLHTALMIWVHNQPVPDKVSLEDIPERFIHLVIPPEVTLPPEQTDAPLDDAGLKETAKKDPGPKKDEAKGEEPKPTPADAPPSEEERRAALASKGLAAIIGTRGDSSQASAVADLLSDSSGVSRDLDQALSGVGAVTVAVRGQDRGGDALRGTNDGAADGSGMGSGFGTGDVVGAGAKEQKKVVSKASAGDADVLGAPSDAKNIRAVVQRKLPQIKACYDEQLKGNPDLEGKVVVFWVIRGSGKVGEVRVQENTTGNKDMEECIIRRIRRWEFNPTEDEQDAEVTYPFIFSASK